MNDLDRQVEVQKLEALANWMDDRFRLPGTNIRFGLDPVLGLVPGVGDSLSALSTAYLIGKARGMGLPGHVQLRMVGNLLLDLVVGSIPLLGNVFDVGFKANRRNVTLIKRHLASKDAEYPSA